jgi:hypothetical protein
MSATVATRLTEKLAYIVDCLKYEGKGDGEACRNCERALAWVKIVQARGGTFKEYAAMRAAERRIDEELTAAERYGDTSRRPYV